MGTKTKKIIKKKKGGKKEVPEDVPEVIENEKPQVEELVASAKTERVTVTEEQESIVEGVEMPITTQIEIGEVTQAEILVQEEIPETKVTSDEKDESDVESNKKIT